MVKAPVGVPEWLERRLARVASAADGEASRALLRMPMLADSDTRLALPSLTCGAAPGVCTAHDYPLNMIVPQLHPVSSRIDGESLADGPFVILSISCPYPQHD